MINLKIVVIPMTKITNSQDIEVKKLQKECFGNIDEEETKKHFFSKGFARVLAYHQNKLVGILELHKRDCHFKNARFLLGGVGGVCVASCMRKQGIGSKLIKKGLEILKSEECAIACMNVDLELVMHKFYEKLGFKMMNREISFEDINGKRVYEKGAMFIPLNSKEIYELVINSNKTFHYGKGYW